MLWTYETSLSFPRKWFYHRSNDWWNFCYRFLMFREFVMDKSGNEKLIVSGLEWQGKLRTISINQLFDIFFLRFLSLFWWTCCAHCRMKKIVEKFRRNENIPFHENVLKRTFDIAEKKIILQFHYGKDDITPTIRVYTCPSIPDYGCEILFSEKDNPVDEVYWEKKWNIFRSDKLLQNRIDFFSL